MLSDQDKQLLVKVGERIRNARIVRSMSQDDLAAAIGKNQNAISRYEAGTHAMGITELPKIAEALGVPIAYLMEESAFEEDFEMIKNYLIPSLRSAALHHLISNIQYQYSTVRYILDRRMMNSNVMEAIEEIDQVMEAERNNLFLHLQESSTRFIALKKKLEVLLDRDAGNVVPHPYNFHWIRGKGASQKE